MSCEPKSSGGGGLWLTWSCPQPGELQQEAGSQLDFQLLVTPAWQDLQVRSVLGCLSNSADRVEAVMCLYPRLVDKDNLWMVLYALKVRNVGQSRYYCSTGALDLCQSPAVMCPDVCSLSRSCLRLAPSRGRARFVFGLPSCFLLPDSVQLPAQHHCLSLQGLEQSQTMALLGLRACFNPKRCSCHYQLDVSYPEHAEVARRLVDMAMKVSCSSLLKVLDRGGVHRRVCAVC